MVALARGLHPCGAPVRAVAGVGVLVVRVELVVDVEDDAARPPAAAHLPLAGAQPVGREVDVVVLVRLRDRARFVHLQEVHRDAEMHRRQIGEAVRGGLVRDGVGVAEVLDRDRAGRLGILQERHRVRLGDEQRTGEVVRLDALAQELRVAARLGVPEDAARQRLQHRRARVALRGQPAREVQPPVLQVGDAAGRVGQVGDVVQRESEVGGDIGCCALRERSARVIHRGQEVAGLSLELGEVVVLTAHQAPQGDVRPPRLLGGGGPLVAEALDLVLQGQHRAQRLVGHGLADPERCDAQRLERLTAHRALDADLERRALVERSGLQERVESGAEGACDRLQQRELRLAAAVLDHRELARSPADGIRQLLQRHAAFGAQLPDTSADRQ